MAAGMPASAQAVTVVAYLTTAAENISGRGVGTGAGASVISTPPEQLISPLLTSSEIFSGVDVDSSNPQRTSFSGASWSRVGASGARRKAEAAAEDRRRKDKYDAMKAELNARRIKE